MYFSYTIGMFVKDLYAISPQSTFDLTFEAGEVLEIVADRYLAHEPNYLEFIPAGQLRRMGKAVRMGIGAGLPLIQRNEPLDGIIIGSANGGLEDCIKFLNQIVDYVLKSISSIQHKVFHQKYQQNNLTLQATFQP